jgi:hypothetical protein
MDDRNSILGGVKIFLFATVANHSLVPIVTAWVPRRPGFASGQHVGFVVDKVALG